MTPNVTGTGFAGQVKDGIFMRNIFMLSEKVDPNALSEAFKRTMADCPYFAQTMVMENGLLVYKEYEPDLTIHPLEEEAGIGGGYGRPLVYVCAGEKTIVVGISHALTDGFGNNLFCHVLLYHYFCIRDGQNYPLPKEFTLAGAIELDTSSDLLGDLDPAGDPAPCSPCLSLAPGEEGPDGSFAVSIDAAAFKRASKEALGLSDDSYEEINRGLFPIGGIACLFTYLMLARAIQKSRPENTLPIGCRFPVNMRYILHKPHAVRNFSAPQAVLSLVPDKLNAENWTEKDTRRLYERLQSELTAENLVADLADVKDSALGGKRPPSPAVIAKFTAPTMLVTNIGALAWEPAFGRITHAEGEYGGFPCKIQITKHEDRQVLYMMQTFASDTYFKGILKELELVGIGDFQIF